MKLATGMVLRGVAGVAVEVVIEEVDTPDHAATVGLWFLDCPGQSPVWSHYVLAIIHLRDIPGVRPATVDIPHATHEVMLVALDPALSPTPLDTSSWRHLRPTNVVEQVQLPDDSAAAALLGDAAQAVVDGTLPAEPPLSGAVEPWRTALIRAAAHWRGEPHAREFG